MSFFEFFSAALRCYVVIDLKMKPFKPEYAGKMNFYLAAVVDLLRHPDDNPSTGLILCKSKTESSPNTPSGTRPLRWESANLNITKISPRNSKELCRPSRRSKPNLGTYTITTNPQLNLPQNQPYPLQHPFDRARPHDIHQS